MEPLNDTGSPYGTINRIVAGVWAETVSPRPYLVLLDTDTVFVSEPLFVRADVGVRPVDHFLAEPRYQADLRQVLKRIGCSSDVLRWIEQRLSFFH